MMTSYHLLDNHLLFKVSPQHNNNKFVQQSIPTNDWTSNNTFSLLRVDRIIALIIILYWNIIYERIEVLDINGKKEPENKKTRTMSENNNNTKKKNALGYDLLQPQTPVPTDIQISQQIVKEVGLLSMQDLAKQLSIVSFRFCHLFFCFFFHA
jgi:hypothetical protein